VSVLFSKNDIFNGSKRLFKVQKEQAEAIKFLKTLFVGSPIRIIIDLKNCKTNLNPQSTRSTSKVCWQNTQFNSSEVSEPFSAIYCGLMYLFSFKQDPSNYYFQICDHYSPVEWRQKLAKKELKKYNVIV